MILCDFPKIGEERFYSFPVCTHSLPAHIPPKDNKKMRMVY